MEIRKLNLESIRKIHGKLQIVQNLCDQIEARDTRIQGLELLLKNIVDDLKPPKRLAEAQDFEIEMTIRVPVGYVKLARETLKLD